MGLMKSELARRRKPRASKNEHIISRGGVSLLGYRLQRSQVNCTYFSFINHPSLLQVDRIAVARRADVNVPSCLI